MSIMLSLTARYLSSVKHNPHSGNLRTLVKRCLELATNLRDESQCERLVLELHVHVLFSTANIRHSRLGRAYDHIIATSKKYGY